MTTANKERLGQYIHRSDRISEIRFKSEGDIERSFTILIAEGYEGDEDPAPHLGLAVLDNDNGQIVFDGYASDKDPSSAVMIFHMAHFESMEWSEFSEACRNAPNYRGGILDIDKRRLLPLPGNPMRQTSLGLMREVKEDIRSEFFRALDDDPETPYSFPPIDRSGAEEEICRHFCYVDRNKSYIAWDIRMNMSWNRTGRFRGGLDVSPDFDYDWRMIVRNRPEIIDEACSRALDPYVSGPTTFLEMEEFPCEFRRIGKNNGFLIIEKFADYYLSATRDVSLSARVARLSDLELEALWGIIRVMDFETSRSQRVEVMEMLMNQIRVEMERATSSVE